MDYKFFIEAIIHQTVVMSSTFGEVIGIYKMQKCQSS